MDFREKDTAIILVCCMLVVLLVIFFLSERQKFILNSYEVSREGSRDTYELTVKKFKPSSDGEKRELVLTRSMFVTRTLLNVGADYKGTMHIETKADRAGSQNAFFNETSGAVDLKIQFLPEGSCNFNFFDADLLNYRGEVVRKGESWKYMRPISIYGKTEKTVQINYSFLGKKKHFSKNTGFISFEVPDKTWLDEGLKRVEGLRGVFLVSEETGKIEEAECSYYKGDEKTGYYFAITLKRVKSRTLSPSDLSTARLRIEHPERFPKTGEVKKSVVPMIAQGNGGELERRIFRKTEQLYTIQVQAFTEKNRALELYRKLRDKGWRDVKVLKKSNIYKVCVGKYRKNSPDCNSHFNILKQVFPDSFVYHPNSKEFLRPSR